MDFIRERVGEILKQLSGLRYPVRLKAEGFTGKAGQFPVTDETKAWLREESRSWTLSPRELGEEPLARFGLAAELRIPEEMEGMPVELRLSTGMEGEWDATNPQIAAYVNGRLRQGMDVNHRSLRLTEHAEAGETFWIFLNVYTGETGNLRGWNACLRCVDQEIQNFYYDLLVPWQCLGMMEEDSLEYEELQDVLNRAVNLLDLRKMGGGAFRESLRRASRELARRVASLPVSRVTAACVGHTHIDVAWLWTLPVTQEKAARSFSTVLSLMERYPEYIFMSSQPQLYAYVKANQPELYERIRERAAQGRWEPEGAMFLEADCNLTGGESLVRQCMYGKQFFREEFGAENRILWLPDVFGYCAALPQIMKKCGIDSFMTTKISWNEKNKIPYDTFWWEGIDGTRVLTHFVTTRDYEKGGRLLGGSQEFTTNFSTNYNGDLNPFQVRGAWQRYQQKGQNQEVLISYGHGDGGGGPTEEMLETARRLRDGHFGCPAVRLEKAGTFFKALHKRAETERFPVWSGELYLEFHRGTYTSMARNKKANRKGEFALCNAECWSVLAREYAGLRYPGRELRAGWEILMRNQFHDILPGSSIQEVYEESKREYEELGELTERISRQALEALAERILGAEAGSWESRARSLGDVAVFNANGTRLDGIVEISEEAWGKVWKNRLSGGTAQDWEAVLACDGELLPVQRAAQGGRIFYARGVPAKGWKTWKMVAAGDGSRSAGTPGPETGFFCTETETVTPYYRLVWNQAGQISSFYDRITGRELLEPGACANVLMTYEDKPHDFDNWNIYEYYKEKAWPVEDLRSRSVIEKGPVRLALELVWTYLDSTIRETFYFYKDSPRIDVRAWIDWKEDQILLKALFPLNLNTREAVCEIQYGHVKRGTTANTSWDQARFEFCFQKWMDLSEYGSGVSFFTDCKYGAGVRGSQVGLTLLKSGRYPNPAADREIHEFTYSFMPHPGSWQEAGTVQEALSLNNPLRAVCRKAQPGPACEPSKSASGEALVSGLPGEYGKAEAAEPNIVVEVLKRSEDESGDILRLYECWNRHTRTVLRFGEPFGKLLLCNMLEQEERILAKNGNEVFLELKPFEILTLKVVNV